MDTNTLLESRSSEVSSSIESVKLKGASVPTMPSRASVIEIKQQISAPAYLYSLKDNDAPLFKKPGPVEKPKLLIGSILNENEVVEMIAFADADKQNGLRQYLGRILVSKQIISNDALPEKHFLITLLTEIIRYAAQRDFDEYKLAALLTIYLDTHRYFKWYYWLPPTALWNYFIEVMVRHTIEDSPTGQEVFGPGECYDIITHFHSVYMANLPLIHIHTFGAYQIKLVWPFNKK